MVTIDLKSFLVGLLLIALTVLVVYLVIMVQNLTTTLKKVNVILDDTQVVTAIVNEKAKETKPVVDDLSSALVGFATNIASLSNLAKSLSSMVSIIRNNK